MRIVEVKKEIKVDEPEQKPNHEQESEKVGVLFF